MKLEKKNLEKNKPITFKLHTTKNKKNRRHTRKYLPQFHEISSILFE